jgi:hypothetical protein
MYGMRNSTSLGNEDSEEKIKDLLFPVVVYPPDEHEVQGLDLVLWMGVWGKTCHTFRVTCGFLLK